LTAHPRAPQPVETNPSVLAAGRRCVFCGGTPVTAEHVWPAWLRTVLPQPIVAPHRRTVQLDGVAQPDVTYPQRVFEQRVRLVCAVCNNGWMSELETANKPFLDAALHGRGRQLHQRGQERLAAWAFKTALMINCTFREHRSGVPQSHYDYLYTHRAPPSDVAIWLASYDGEQPAAAFSSGMAISRPGERVDSHDAPNVYTITFTLGPLALQVFGVHDAAAIRVDPRGGEYADPGIHQLWPYDAPFTWVPRPALTGEGLQRFADSIYDELLRHVGRR
jgi:hypothetical protein